MSDWYLIDNKSPYPAAKNMAVDEYLFNLCHKEKKGFFRLYYWDKPSFSIGVSQRAEKAANIDYINSSDYAFVRRITGGKTVLHNDEITYSVVSSENIFFQDNDLYRSYSMISGIILKALKISGIDAYLSGGSTPALSKSNDPCFSFPTPNEIEVEGKKIVGSAQKRDRQALLQHGSIPYSMNYSIYASGANSRKSIIKKNMITLEDLTDLSRDEIGDNFIKAFSEFTGKELKNYIFTERDNREIEKLTDKYSSKEWNFIL
ncbi:MAG: biotin/lipoate A/B protein ligase family protein [Acidobacteriota bacterium]